MAFLSPQQPTSTTYRLPSTSSQTQAEYTRSSITPTVPQQVATATDITAIKEIFPLSIEGHTLFYTDAVESLRTALQNEHRHYGPTIDPSTPIPFETAISTLSTHLQKLAPTWFEATPSSRRSFAVMFDYVPLYSFLVDENPLGIDTNTVDIPYHNDVHSDLIGAVLAALLAYLRDVNGIDISTPSHR